jgi:AcrR family transcriptional regulator
METSSFIYYVVVRTANDSLQDRYYVAGLQILAEDGYGGLKLAPLCARLGVTTGAFYHSFDSWQDYTTRLIDHWHTERTTRTSELARSQGDVNERIDLLMQAGISLPHSAEAAIRVWAGIDPAVAAVQEDVDRERLSAVTEAFEALIGDPESAAVLARAALYLLIGYEQSTGAHDVATLEWSLQQFRALATAMAESSPKTFSERP